MFLSVFRFFLPCFLIFSVPPKVRRVKRQADQNAKKRAKRTDKFELFWICVGNFFKQLFVFLPCCQSVFFPFCFAFSFLARLLFSFSDYWLCFAFSSRNFLLQHIAIWPVGYLWFSRNTMWGNYRLILEKRRKSEVFHGFSTFSVEAKERVHVCFQLSTVQTPRLDILGDNMFFIFIVQFIPCDQRIQLLQVSLKGCWCRYR